MPASFWHDCQSNSARVCKVAQSRDQPARARKRTIWARWRGSVRTAQAAAEAECEPLMQATSRRQSKPTEDVGKCRTAKKVLARGREVAKIIKGLPFRATVFEARVTVSPHQNSGKGSLSF